MSFDEHPVPYRAFCYPSQGRHLILLRFCLFLCLLLKTILESISSVMEHFKQLCAEMPLKIKWQSQRPTALARKIKEPAQHPSPATITIMHCKERGWCTTLCALNWNHGSEKLPGHLHCLPSSQQCLGMHYRAGKMNNQWTNKGEPQFYFFWAIQGKGQKWHKNGASSCKTVSSCEIHSWFVYLELGKIRFIFVHKMGKRLILWLCRVCMTNTNPLYC